MTIFLALLRAALYLEARLGVRLLHRTTRSVAPTEAGARLLARLGRVFSELDADRARALIAHLPPGQAVLTTTGPLPPPAAPERRSGEFRGRRRVFWVWPHEKHYIWGATAAILVNLARVLRG